MVALRPLIVWLLVAAAQVLLALARDGLARPGVQVAAELTADALAIAGVFAVTWWAWPGLRLRTARQALIAGVVWAAFSALADAALRRALGDPGGLAALSSGWPSLGLIAILLTPWGVRILRRRDDRRRLIDVRR